MLLALDVRNDSVALGVAAEGNAWPLRVRLSNPSERTRDEWTNQIGSLLSARGIAVEELAAGIVSSVVPLRTEVFVSAVASLLGGKLPLVVGPGVRTGVKLRVENPAELGTDLVSNAAAALSALKPPCVIVDFGLAITLTALDARGELTGVVIAPGQEIAMQALRSNAAQLPQVRLDQATQVLGRTTAESIRAGLVLGWEGLVDRLVERLTRELSEGGGQVALVGTGTAERAPLNLERAFSLWDPWLTLEGLARIAALNSAVK